MRDDGSQDNAQWSPERAKAIAESYAWALNQQVIDEDVVSLWVEVVIATVDEPHHAFLEASQAENRADRISALHEVPGEPDPQVVARLCIGHLHRWLQGDPSRAQEVAKKLYFMAMDDEVPEATAVFAMCSFWDDLDLAMEGVHGDPESVRSDLDRFLEEYGDRV